MYDNIINNNTHIYYFPRSVFRYKNLNHVEKTAVNHHYLYNTAIQYRLMLFA